MCRLRRVIQRQRFRCPTSNPSASREEYMVQEKGGAAAPPYRRRIRKFLKCFKTSRSGPPGRVDTYQSDWGGASLRWNTAGAKLVVDSFSIAVAQRPDHCVGETISKCRVYPLQVSTTFKKVRIQKVRVQRILLNMLPIDSRLPGAFFRGGPIDQSQIISHRQTGLECLVLIQLHTAGKRVWISAIL